MASLRIIKGLGERVTHDVRTRALLGRSRKCDVVLEDKGASRQHAIITRTRDGYVLEDLGSRNGTYVNSERVRRAALPDGARIQICGSLLEFRDEKTAQLASTAPQTVALKKDWGPGLPPAVSCGVTATTDVFYNETLQIETRAQSQRFRERLTVLSRVSEAISTVLDLDALPSEVIAWLFQVFPEAERGAVLLKDRGSGELVTQEARSRSTACGQELSLSTAVVEKAMTSRQSLLGILDHPGQRAMARLANSEWGTRSMMCAPLVCRGEAIGLLYLDCSTAQKQFGEEDLSLLSALATEAALAVENATLHERLLAMERIESDLKLAHKIQKSFLPRGTPEIAGYDFRVHYSSAMEVGGDFYDFIKLSPSHLAIILGDVSGKGVSAALLMAKLMSEVRAETRGLSEARAFLSTINGVVAGEVEEDIFATLLLMMLDTESGTLTAASAGHPFPLVRRGRAPEVEELAVPAGFPLGLYPGAEYGQGSYTLNPGDVIVAYTDGIVEAMDAADTVYGEDRLREVMTAKAASPETTMAQILEDVDQFVGERDQSDDRVLMCFGPTPAPS